MKNKLSLLLIVAGMLSLTSCFLFSPYSGITNNPIPQIPDSLSGGDAAAARSLAAKSITSRDFDSDAMMNEYDRFIVVPELAYNYNKYVDGSVDPFVENAKTNGFWSNISAAPFTKETSSDGMTLRANDDFTEYEIYHVTETETRYLRVEETATYTHALLIVDGLSGGTAMDSCEVIETEAYIYSKVTRFHDMDTTPLLQSFNGITDKSTAANNTTGRYINYVFNSVPASFVFPEGPGDTMDMDYWTQEDYQGAVGPGAVYKIYGFFDDTNNYNITSTIDFAADGYPDPQDLKPYFSTGMNHEILGAVDLITVPGTGGIDFPEWDESLIK